MRPRISALTLVCALTGALIVAGSAAAGELRVPIDQSTRISLSGPASDVFVGNPAIADVAVIDRHSLVVTGKGYGITNLIAVDDAGRTLYSSRVVVGAGDGVVVQRGVKASSYSCAEACQPTANFSANTAPGAQVTAALASALGAVAGKP